MNEYTKAYQTAWYKAIALIGLMFSVIAVCVVVDILVK